MVRPNKGEFLKNLRLNHKLTLDEVGNIIGVSKQTLYKYENNIITNIPSDKIELLAKLYNVTPANIMGWEEESQGYYTDPEVAKLAEEARINPDIRILFSASKDLSKKDMEKTIEFVKFLKSQKRDDSDFSDDVPDEHFTE